MSAVPAGSFRINVLIDFVTIRIGISTQDLAILFAGIIIGSFAIIDWHILYNTSFILSEISDFIGYSLPEN